MELQGSQTASGCRFAIVVSRFNAEVTEGLLGGARRALAEASVGENDIVILITYAQMTTDEAKAYTPRVVHVDKDNRIVQIGNDPAEGHTTGLMRPPFALNNATCS